MMLADMVDIAALMIFSYGCGMQIDHDPNEPPVDRTRGPWLMAAVVLALLWAWYFYFMPFVWPALALGFMTGGIFTAWIIEITGNKTPASWRRNPPGSGRS